MGRSRESLLDAAFSNSEQRREDRLTEVFATVLERCDELAAALFTEVALPVGERFQVFTQVAVTKRDKPDMLIHSLDRGGAVVSRVWSEHKVGSGFGDLQRERYLETLRGLPGEGRLIFIVADAPASRESGDWRGFTWQEIGEIAESLGRRWGDRHWRERARDGGAPAKWRLLYELLWYLEEKEELAVLHALDTGNLTAYRLMEETAHAVAALLERAAQNAAPFRPVGKMGEDFPAMWQHFETPPGSWLERAGSEGAAELVVSDRDYWSPEELDEPAFAAGYSLPEAFHPRLSSNREWVRRVDDAGFCCELWADHACIYRTLAMSEILGFGDTLVGQAEGVGRWAREAIVALGAIDPGDLAGPGG